VSRVFQVYAKSFPTITMQSRRAAGRSGSVTFRSSPRNAIDRLHVHLRPRICLFWTCTSVF